ncbi:MAG: formylmethanofuran--tetrahydromethanopterin N-formyltransferase [Pirellulales bacterium]|jgi:formylmethanofuran--tetrahydromethanopterin N-formyltransferase|nr:formylmethanofuran--tetrahydromethanopterin N-formyltransferase [Pirellulales bacterium]
MQIGQTTILDTFAEAFDMRYTRLVVTASEDYWLDIALREATGYSTSVIACDAETGVSQSIKPESTPDGRCGAALLMFGFSTAAIMKAVVGRVGQCIMTCPTTACFNGLSDAVETIPLGKHLRFFGDGYQKSKKISADRYWRIPVMDGEFLVEDQAGIAKGVAGGNIILQAESQATGLAAARRAAEAIRETPGVITPFPGGVVRSGSKVGSRYKGLKASTADAYCPTLRGRVESQLLTDAHCAYEIVIDGTDEPTVGQAMRIAIEAAAGEGVLAIGAGNYGGKLGKHHFHLRELLR